MKKNILFIVLLFTVFMKHSFAQAPGGMNYQAVARDISGAILANQNICVNAIVTDGNGGPSLYTESANLMTNQFGLFTMNIGATDPAGFKAINWAGVTPWLDVKIDIGCTTNMVDMGSSQLLSVPYALNSADNHWNASGNDIWNSNSGNVLIGTGAFSSARLNVSEGGLQSTAEFYKTNASSSATVVFASHAGSGNCFGGFQAGTGRVGYFYTYNTTNPSESFYIRNEGIGAGEIIDVNNTSNSSIGLLLTQKGTGEAGHFQITNTSSLSNSIYALTDGGGSAIAALNSGAGIGVYSYITGTGTSGNFTISNPSNSSAALSASTNGTGAACSFTNNNVSSTSNGVEVSIAGSGASLYSNNYGTGTAGYFQVSNPSSTSNALYIGTNGGGNSAVYAMNTGTGRAGNFQINNASNGVPALYAATNGSGPSVWGYNSGTGIAGNFEINNASSGSAALNVSTSGNGSAGVFSNTNASAYAHGVNASVQGSGNAVYASTTGTGSAGYLYCNNSSSNADAVFAATNGTGGAVHGQNTGIGAAGVFDIQNAANSNNALSAATFGTGKAGYFYSGNALSADAIVFISGAGTGKFIDAGNGAFLSNGGVWTNASDINLKENIVEVNGASILDKVNHLLISQWNYKREGANVMHIGPMAQDFHRLFSLGNDDKSISTIDPAGIALAAIKEQQKLITDLQQQNVELKRRIDALEKK